MDDSKRISKIVQQYVKYKEEENKMFKKKPLPLFFGITCVEDLLNIHQKICALDLKRMSGDLKDENTKYDVFEDINITLLNLDKESDTLNKSIPGVTFTPKYAISAKNKRPVGRPKAKSIEVFREMYRPEAKIYTIKEITNIPTNNIWTIERRPLRNPKSDKLYILPGVRQNNLEKQWEVTGYIVTEVPWTDDIEQYKWNQPQPQTKEKANELQVSTDISKTSTD